MKKTLSSPEMIRPYLGLGDQAFREFSSSFITRAEFTREEQQEVQRRELYSRASPVEHLHAHTAEMLQLSKYERMQAMERQKWIPYPQARHIHSIMEDMYHQLRRRPLASGPEWKAPPVVTPDLVILGEPNNGISSLLRAFTGRPHVDTYMGRLVWPVLTAAMPARPTPRAFYGALLSSMFIPYSSQSSEETLRQHIWQQINYHETRLVLVDDIHHVFALKGKQQTQMLMAISDLLQGQGQWLIWAGHAPENGQLPGIGPSTQVEHLPRWEYSADYRRLLVSFAYLLPLKRPSALQSEALGQFILTQSQGRIGTIAKLLTRAAQLAIRTNEEAITLDLLEQATRELDMPFDMSVEEEAHFTAKVLQRGS